MTKELNVQVDEIVRAMRENFPKLLRCSLTDEIWEMAEEFADENEIQWSREAYQIAANQLTPNVLEDYEEVMAEEEDENEVRVVDPYNVDKVWLIKKYPNSTFYINQEIKGKKFYKNYQQTNKKHLKEIGIIDKIIFK